MKHNIYGMSENGNTKNIRYVGSTIFPLEKRLKEHIKDAKRKEYKGSKRWKDKTHRAKWIRLLLRKNKKPIMHLLECKTEYDDNLEKNWILKLRNEGYNLVNHSDGGKAFMLGKHHSEETKIKMRKARLGYKVAEDVKKKQSLGGNPFATKILQYDKKGNFIKKWDCVTEASIALGNKSHGNICVCCQKNAGLSKLIGKTNSPFYTAHGYVWRYENDVNKRKKSGCKRIEKEIERRNIYATFSC